MEGGCKKNGAKMKDARIHCSVASKTVILNSKLLL